MKFIHMKWHNKIGLFTVIAFLIILEYGCKKDEVVSVNPTNGLTTAVFNPDLTYGTLTDQDGNIYKTIRIGNQTWMAENLRVTHYRNGDAIPNITDTTQWATQTEGAWCNYNNTEDITAIAT